MLRQWYFEIELELDNKQVPVYKQLAAKIQEMIETGILKNGDLLPGGREIAQKLNVSRKTVLSAMELLVYSGWLENRERVGLFVRNPQPSPNKVSQHSDIASPPPHDPIATNSAPSLVINDGYPDTQLLPFKELSSAFRQLFNRAARWQMLGYNDSRASKVYRERLQYATELIRKELGEKVSYKKPDGGLAFWMEFPADPTDRLAQSGISASIVKLSNQRFGMRVGYASMQKDEMERLIMALR